MGSPEHVSILPARCNISTQNVHVSRWDLYYICSLMPSFAIFLLIHFYPETSISFRLTTVIIYLMSVGAVTECLRSSNHQ